MSNFCIIIPGYNEAGRIGAVVKAAKAYCPDIVVIDDGSKDSTADEARKAGATVIVHEVNKGKGVALNTGFLYAKDKGYEFLITMDADGQHDPADIPGFIDAYKSGNYACIVGNRMAKVQGMPLVRKLTNLFMSWLISREMHQWVPDTQNGFRLFKCSAIPQVSAESARFAAESEILLIMSDNGVKIGSAPVKVIYSDEKSKIHPVKDTVRFFKMLKRYRKRNLKQSNEKDKGETRNTKLEIRN
jgi:glycosyltransferase involved in cell wall biosynthesis